jgi:hypothetical protein
MPGRSGVTVVTTLVCFIFYHIRGCGCIKRPTSQRSLPSEGKEFLGNLGRTKLRDREGVIGVIAV